MIHIGVLDLQGSISEHICLLNKINNTKVIRVKYKEDLENIDGLIIPGGESTTIGKLLDDFKLMEPIRDRILEGMPVWGTCAGLILLVKTIDDQKSNYLAVMDIQAKRNAYGSQKDSFIVDEPISTISESPIPLIFIRAPYITAMEDNVDVLKAVGGHIVAARQHNMLVTSFHPELTEDTSVHKYFINMINDGRTH